MVFRADDFERISYPRGSGALLRSSKICMREPVVLLRSWNKKKSAFME